MMKSAEPYLRGDIVALVEEMTPLLGFAPSLRLGAGLGAPVSPELAGQVLAALREALSNAARHADASQVDVTVDVDPDGMLTVLVIDDGAGIPGEAHAQRAAQPGRAGREARRQAPARPGRSDGAHSGNQAGMAGTCAADGGPGELSLALRKDPHHPGQSGGGRERGVMRASFPRCSVASGPALVRMPRIKHSRVPYVHELRSIFRSRPISSGSVTSRDGPIAVTLQPACWASRQSVSNATTARRVAAASLPSPSVLMTMSPLSSAKLTSSTAGSACRV